MAKQTDPTSPEEKALFKGKVPRNVMIAVGAIAALAIGGLGFYTQTIEANKAEAEALQAKRERAAEAVERSSANKTDVDKIIEEQQAEARRRAAEAAAASSAAAAANAKKPTLSADAVLPTGNTEELKASNDQDSIFVSPIFRAGVKVKDAQPQQPQLPNGVISPQQMLLQQAAAQDAAVKEATAQAALASRGGQGVGAMTTQKRDTAFLNDVAQLSEGNKDFARTGIVGQSHGCTLSPPAKIPVLSSEALNSDRPGTASLIVESDVYANNGDGRCLVIPWGTTIVAPYSSDIQPGQESILVAGAEMRLPNGKHVPLYGAQGANGDGAAGFSGHVNNHFLRIYSTSFLTAILVRAFSNSDQSTTTGPLGVTQAGSTAGQIAAQTAQSVLDRYKNIPPTITSSPGERHFMLKVNRDMVLEQYRGPR
ncbi:TrbI/VirB10 family protein [Burkholderia vietnamiensis]|jgi:type IV secretion system protein VirB10|uniref:Conjugation TrbI family protein n=3 Tax=Burkholderia vietnamiensis TaxID=60552 RepID=A4JUI8_BURVG|nr:MULTISPECIES: TrbI/VirB10 family protein [Burkholderia]ABO59941.1 conjugation TrbI family protein [Burkholderia vietnamiensis G4]KVE73300.1 conjugal transfer protein TraI [Burkholderia vietnamiensis]KVF02284.1 conjugal transfer protein TraI [Burkholderia vietnamiensis]KVF63312.1 conjugal transfer protein TraI [Burkholderia vietnamiensis]KVR84945.1 conjugal transfer protein TraI [Burkholderia vietnamiensis]